MPYQTQERECLNCGDPIEGRADKQFCNSACKARYNREQHETALATVSLVRPATSLPLTQRQTDPIEPNEDDEENDSLEAYEQEQLEVRNRQKAQQLHNLHTRIVGQFLKQEGETFTKKNL